MRLARKLTLFAMTAMSLVALVAPQAFAQEPLTHTQAPDLEARVEPGGGLCPPVTPSPAPVPGPALTNGGCRVHFSGNNIVIVAHIFGFEAVDSTCNIEFDARFDASAEGYFTHMEFVQGTQGTCTRRPCLIPSEANPEGRAWSFYSRETATPPREVITVLMCIWGTVNMTDTHLELSIPFTETEGGIATNHRYNLVANDLACHGLTGFRCELTGQWNTEMVPSTNGEGQTEQQIEINHL